MDLIIKRVGENRNEVMHVIPPLSLKDDSGGFLNDKNILRKEHD